MTYHYPCSLHDIRQLLNLVFDDSGLDAFCLDYFPKVYEQFGRGMGKQEKLNRLLEHYHAPSRFTMLLQVICDYDHPDFKAFCAEKGIQFKTVISPDQTALPAIPSYLSTQIHNFDMTELMTECLDHLLDRQGFIGFVVPNNSAVFLRNFCERLKYEWGRNHIRLKQPLPLTIDPILLPLDRALLTIKRRYLVSLQEGDILFAVEVRDSDQVEAFWRSLSQQLVGIMLPNRVIVIIGTNKRLEPVPEDLIALRPPRFRHAHIHRWVKQVVETFAWPDELAKRWTDQMIAECSDNNELFIEWVYDHLEAMVELLKQNPPVDHFQQELDRRRQLYVQTSY